MEQPHAGVPRGPGTAASATAVVADAVVTIAGDSRIVFANPAVERVFGHKPEDLIGQPLDILIPERFRQPHHGGMRRYAATGERRLAWGGMELPALRRDGTEIMIEISLGEYTVGEQRFITAVIRDVTARTLAVDTLRASEQRYRQLFEQNVAGVYRVDVDGRVLAVNESMARMLGYRREELIGMHASEVYFDATDREAWMRELDERGSLVNFVLKMRRKDGSPLYTLENCSLVDDPVTGAKVVLGTAIDVTERKALEDRLERMAYHDPLTGLANRRMLQEMADKAIARANRDSGRVALLYVDLIRFKRINDVLGHSAGDMVLKEVAWRFSSLVRATDTLARVGGDEFALLLVSASNLESVLQPARKVREALSRPFVVEGETFHLDARIGIAVHPEHAANFDELLSNADLAMHQPNLANGDIAIFRPIDSRHRREDLLVEERIRHALAADEFLLHFQPIFRLSPREAVSVEALARWRQADGRLVGADQFIPVAERMGLIRQIDRWALRAAMRQLREWADGPGPAWIALNLTPSMFDDADFPVLMRTALQEEQVSGERVALEVTERLTMRDPVLAARILHELKALGIRIVIDDFGRGHSSLAYLRDFPVDAIKVDRAFVEKLGTSEPQERLVEGIIGLSQGLGIELVAEGIENAEQLEWLESHGCAYGQGYYLHLPAPPETVRELFDRAPSGPLLAGPARAATA